MFCTKPPKKTIEDDIREFEDWKRDQETFQRTHPDIFMSSKFENNAVLAQSNSWSRELTFTIIKKVLVLESVNDTVDDECCICLSKIRGSHLKTSECNHHFHTKCIEKLIKSNNKNNIITRCPLCRSGPDEDCEEQIRTLKRSWNRQYSYSDGSSRYSNDS